MHPSVATWQETCKDERKRGRLRTTGNHIDQCVKPRLLVEVWRAVSHRSRVSGLSGCDRRQAERAATARAQTRVGAYLRTPAPGAHTCR